MAQAKIISTKSSDWVVQCSECAARQEGFELHGLESQNIEFLKSLCAKYGFRYKYAMDGNELVAIMTPFPP